MRPSFLSKLNQYLRSARTWYEATPERALDQAYDAALMIQSIENEHFGGSKISATGQHSSNTHAYFESELKRCLKIAELRLQEFKLCRHFFNTTDGSANARSGNYSLSNRDRSAVILEKLRFVDQVLERYRQPPESLSLVPINGTQNSPAVQDGTISNFRKLEVSLDENADDNEGILDKTGVLPRSIAGTLNRIKRDLDPSSEGRVVQNFRNTRAKTIVSIRFLLLLIIIPLLTQQLSKAIIVGPTVDFFRKPAQATDIFINFELEEEALRELQTFKERLEFDMMLGHAPGFSRGQEGGESRGREGENPPERNEARPDAAPEKKPEERTPESGRSSTLQRFNSQSYQPSAVLVQETAPPISREAYIEKRVQEKAQEIAKDYFNQSSGAIKNVFADLFALGAFAIVIATNQREIAVLKSFIDETVYGLSDSAKAFVIILFTDMFVGFHSPHGWEVLLEGLCRHLGLPESRQFIFLFIATFPVILDTIFKYWIFRYLNRISPSAVATYRTMNE